MAGLLLVSGCPRSGTSLCMDIQRLAHGEDAILGEKFPQEARKKAREEMREPQEGETEAFARCRAYLLEKHELSEEQSMSRDEAKWRDMNPEGFWEMQFTVRGVRYRRHFKELLRGVLDGDFKVCKVVSQGLLASDPMYIGKIVYMIRHPRAVAKSQERLTRGFDIVNSEGRVQNIFEGLVIHTPEMFINVTTQACTFLLENPDIPIRFYHFEELLEKPKETIDDMQEFVGCGDYSKAYEVVQQRLNRSLHEDVENDLWDDAEYVYDNFCVAADLINDGSRKEAEPFFRAVVDRVRDPKSQTSRQQRSWRCYRAKMMVNENICRQCMNDPATRGNFMKNSESNAGQVAKHWSQEPCLFECGFDLDRKEYLTFEESIEHHFWITGMPLRYSG